MDSSGSRRTTPELGNKLHCATVTLTQPPTKHPSHIASMASVHAGLILKYTSRKKQTPARRLRTSRQTTRTGLFGIISCSVELSLAMPGNQPTAERKRLHCCQDNQPTLFSATFYICITIVAPIKPAQVQHPWNRAKQRTTNVTEN